MKTILSIWLSFTLLTAGLPMPGHTGVSSLATEPAARQEGLITKKQTSVGRQKQERPREEEGIGEEEEPREEAEAFEEKREITEETAGEALEEEKPDGEEEPGGSEEETGKEEQKPGKEKKASRGETDTEGKGKKGLVGGRMEQAEKADTPGQEAEEAMKAASEQRQASQIIEIDQTEDKKTLVFEEGETFNYLERTGYHLEAGRKFKCRHKATEINASIKSKKAPIPLNPTESQLLNGVELTGRLKNSKFKTSVRATDAGGINNTVSHLSLDVEVEAPGSDGGNLKEGISGPCVCPDGYAGYAYFEIHYSYCPNTERYYRVAGSHIWLGCTKGDDGVPEYHPNPFAHEFGTYRYVPNKYKVVYVSNGGNGTVDAQNATYDEALALKTGKKLSRPGYTLTGWNTKANGKGDAFKPGEKTKNMTSEDGGEVKLYAQWKPNTLTVNYDANGGSVDSGKAKEDIDSFTHKWNYGTESKEPENFGFFGLSRIGYKKKDGAEWNKKPDGSGASFAQKTAYAMTQYAPKLTAESKDITLYAQWVPMVYKITLDNCLTDPDKVGTEGIYKKYETGIFRDDKCKQKLTAKEPVVLPEKDGYKFKGYYSETGTEMINANGCLTDEGESRAAAVGSETWQARYGYLVGCEDYADIPCDLERTDGDSREDPGVRIFYDQNAKSVTAWTGQDRCSISLIGQPVGTEIGKFRSTLSAGSSFGNTASSQSAEFSVTVPEGAAYRLSVVRDGKSLCDRLVYYKDGRFRTLAFLGRKEAEELVSGSSIAGSAWNKQGAKDYDLYQYYGCSEIRRVNEPGTVQRYFRYKDVNMAYSGNGATAGRNTLEYDVSLEDMYQFRENRFFREQIEKKYTKDRIEYECKVRYSFQGWEISNQSYQEKQQEWETDIYTSAKKTGGIAYSTLENLTTYQVAEPTYAFPGINVNKPFEAEKTESEQGIYADRRGIDAKAKNHSEEYLNIAAKWNACPTIVVIPGKKLEFYEGEEVTKEKLVSYLTAHDNEDNGKSYPDMNDRLRIVKVAYPEPKNHSQEAYEKSYNEDVPAGFCLDTYYMKLEKDEEVQVMVTFAVTDSAGNTTQEKIPVKVKYNNYPEISSEEVFYYLKEEANRGEITAESLVSRAFAEDREDGDITRKLELKEFDAQAIKLQTEPKAKYSVTYKVTDAYKKTTYKTVNLIVWDEQAAIAQMPKCYVRYISEKYLDTLEENSVWREPENFAYLKHILGNKTPIEIWEFTHEDVLAVQEWMTEGGEGHWKVGTQANQQFLAKFAHCRR